MLVITPHDRLNLGPTEALLDFLDPDQLAAWLPSKSELPLACAAPRHFFSALVTSSEQLMERVREVIELYLELEGHPLTATQLGFKTLRVKGRHHFLRHSDGRTTVVPIHAGETVGPGLLNSTVRHVQRFRDDPQRFR